MSGQRAILAQAKGRGYIVARQNDAGRKASGAWWRLCRNGRLPYVRVTPRRTYAGIMLDMDAAGVALQPWAVRAGGALFERYAAGQPNGKGPSWYAVGPWSCYIADVRIDAAADLALELTEIALVDLQGRELVAELSAIVAETW